MMDICDKLQEIGDLRPGAAMPLWASDDTGNWAIGLSKLMLEARTEIVRLRALCGAVSKGESFSDIRKTLGG